MALKHGYDPRQLRIGKNGIADEWKCNVCEGKFTHYTDILTHVNKEHNGKGIRLTCEVSYIYIDYLNNGHGHSVVECKSSDLVVLGSNPGRACFSVH